MSTDKTNTTDENVTPLGDTSPVRMGKHGRALTRKKQPTDPYRKRSGRALLQTAEREMTKGNAIISNYVKDWNEERKESRSFRKAAERQWAKDDEFKSSTEENFGKVLTMIEQTNDPQGLLRKTKLAEEAKAKADSLREKDRVNRRKAEAEARDLSAQLRGSEREKADLQKKLAAAKIE